MKCRFIDTGFNDAFTNMAIDETILQHCQIPTLRVYSWSPKAVSIGYNQNIIKEINLDYCKKNNIEIVRRLTGGKAVFHDREITYSFIIPEKLNLLSNNINESYKEIANALLIALEKVGLKAEIKKVPEKIATPICFNSSNWYELLVNGRKISGSAQRRFNGKVLQHGPILIDFDYNKNNSIFNSDNDFDTRENLRFSVSWKSSISMTIENLKQRITSLKRELNKEISYRELAEAIKLGFKENFDFDIVDTSLTQEEIKLAEKLRKEKYSTEEWNYRLLAKTI